jgi:tetratricopeptide (TPR) repeat protein
MSLFVNVSNVLSDKIKTLFVDIIENEKNGQERSVRKVCDVCSKYLEYGELRYDKVENGISSLEKVQSAGNAFYLMLLAILNESLDEDLIAVKHLTELSGSSLAEPFHKELGDFITIGRFVTLKEYDMLENAGLILIERYTNESNIAETLTNLYFKAEEIEYLPVFQRLLGRAKELYPAGIQLETASGFINMMGKNYEQALESFMAVKCSMEQDRDSKFYNFNLASIWNSIAGCYLKLDNASKTTESCDTALSYDEKTEDYIIGNSILYKKAEALLLMGEKDQALAIVKQILDENEDDENAQAIREKIVGEI